MASLAPSSSGPASSKVLTITVSENNILLVGPEALNPSNIYDRLGIDHVGEHKVYGSLRDLILFVNADGTLSLEGETLTNILAASPTYAMNGIRFLRRGRIAEELTEIEVSKYIADFPSGVLAQNNAGPQEINVNDIDIEKAVQTMKSVLKSDDAKIILGENATAMLDILGIDESDEIALQAFEIVKKDHTYSCLSSSQTSANSQEKWDSLPASQKESADSASTINTGSTVGLRASVKHPKVTIGTLDDIVSLSKSCVMQKERAKTLVAQLPSIPPQLLGGSPVKSSPSRTRSGLTEAMLDEKFRQELLDNEDYAPCSGTSSDTDMKRYVFSPDKPATFPDSAESDFSFSSPKSLNKSPLNKSPQTPPRKVAAGKTKKLAAVKRGKAGSADAEGKKQSVMNEKSSQPKATPKQEDLTGGLQEAIAQTKAADAKAAETKAAEAKAAEAKASAKKHYPKRENRRPPGRLQDALQPPLFSAPDVIRRFSTDNKLEEKEADSLLVEPEVEEPTPKLPAQNRVPVVDTTPPKDDLTSLPGPTELPKKVKEPVQAKKESATKNPLKENQADPPAQTPTDIEPKVSKRIRKRKVVFSESEESSLPTKMKKPRKSAIGASKKSPPTKPAKLKQSKPRQSLELSSGEDKEDDDDDDNSSNASWNSEDDPDRLWCICKKPHNNRFMICCDSCLDWFHGHCVGVTKAQGKQMEDDGHEWTCPSCKRIKAKASPKEGAPSKTPAKAAKRRSTSPGQVATHKRFKSDPKKADKQSQDFSPSQIMFCIVCKKHARVNSVYCSDECILQHANTSKSVPIEKLTPNSLKKATGSPGQVLEKGSKLLVNKPVKQLQVASKSPLLVKPLVKSPATVKKPGFLVTKVKAQSPKVLNVTKSIVVVKVHPKSSPTSRSPVKKPVEIKRDSNEPDPIRVAVRDSLASVLFTRLQGCDDFKQIPLPDVNQMAVNIEAELYTYFGSTGAKYKSKYRSLSFNIKDEPNMTLFRKIAEKAVSPYELVRLSPEELASQQLAQWREQESKHQLDIIKKNELEMMTVNKLIVMKTHKGEEVIETERGNSQTSVLEFDVGNSEEDVNANSATSASDNASASGSQESANSSVKKESSKSSSSSRHSKSRSRGHDRKRSSRDGGKSRRDRDKERSGHKKSKHHERSRNSESKKSDSKTRVLSDKSSTDELSSSLPSSGEMQSAISAIPTACPIPVADIKEPKLVKELKSEEPKLVKELKSEEPKLVKELKSEEPKLVKELKSEEPKLVKELKSEEPKLVKELKSEEPKSEKEPKIETELKTEKKTKSDKDSKSETQSDKGSKSEAQASWTGSVSMLDVCRFDAKIQVVSGNVTAACKDLPGSIEIVGRIEPEVVWQYVAKIKRSGTKVIQVIRVSPENEDESARYSILFTYLNTRNRVGVAGKLPSSIKDLYILPLPKGSALPSVLMPLDGPGLDEDHPHLLLGVIVRLKKGHKTGSSASSLPSSQDSGRSSTPPGYPRKKAAKIKVKVSKNSFPPARINSEEYDDGDEPYSPGGESDTSSISVTLPSSDYAAQVEELNRKIAFEKQEIESMSTAIIPKSAPADDSGNEAYSPSASYTPPHESTFSIPGLDPITLPKLMATTSITLPNNLEEILANVKKNTDAKMDLRSDPIVKNYSERKETRRKTAVYVPTTMAAAPPVPQKSRDPRSAKAKASSTLSRLSDAELIEKAAAEMDSTASTTPPHESASFPFPGNYPPPGYPVQHPPPNYRSQMPMMGPRMPPGPPGMMYPPYHMQFGSPPYMQPPPPMGYNQSPFPGPMPGGPGFQPDEGYHTRASSRERRGRSRWSPAGSSARTGKRPVGKRQKPKDSKASRGD